MVRRIDYIELQKIITVSEAILKSKEQYHYCLAKMLNNPETTSKTYWAILKTFHNGRKILLIPLLLIINDKLESKFGEKTNNFNDFLQVYSMEQWKYLTSFLIRYTYSRTFFLSI